jgi:hypothetical protein
MSNYGLSIKFLPEPQRVISAATIAGSPGAYLGVGTAIANPARQFLIWNLTDAELQFSFDGINDHFPLPGNGFFLDDISSNQSASQSYLLAQGTRLYVKTIGTPSTGSVYFTVFYGYSTY